MTQQGSLNLIPVILCGGAGMRLWPLSRKYFPKQFVPLPINEHKDNLFHVTLQRTAAFKPQQVVIVCNKAHRFFVSDSLHGFDDVDFSILLEPVARNTAPAIALAAFRIVEQQGDGLMLVLPSDHMVADVAGFERVVRTALPAAADHLVTFGIVPERPETGYGYIRKGGALMVAGQKADTAFHAAEFKEKPDTATAQHWLETGDYYWNSGMFLFKASMYLEQLKSYAPEVHAGSAEAYAKHSRDLNFICAEEESFASCPDISVDYAVMEKADKVALVPARIGWNDIGSWDAFASLLQHDDCGNALVGDAVFKDASGNIVYADGRLVTVLGVEDCVIAETPDAVLVAKREKAQDVKQLVEKLREYKRDDEIENHRKVYRPWGSYESVDAGDGFQVKRLIVNPKQSLSLQMHHHRCEHWVVVCGEVSVTRGEEQFMLGANQSTYIAAETRHRLENLGDKPAHLIEVQCGDYLGEDDIVRFEDNYGRTGQC